MVASLRALANTIDRLDPPTSLKDILQRHRWQPGNLGPPASLRRIVNRHIHPQRKDIRFLSYNTYLIQTPVGGAPARPERARDMGAQFANDGYGLLALCEVWQDDLRDLVLHGWPSYWIAEGPRASGDSLDKNSGLIAISVNHPITYQASYAFREKGDRTRDADAWSTKGVLLTRIDLGFGCIDLYSTHLFAGGGLIGNPSVEEIACIQRKQLNEFISFYQMTHNAALQNVAIVTGDFNVNGRTGQDCFLFDALSIACNVEDVWRIQWGDVATGGYSSTGNYGGYTNTDHEHDDGAEISLRMPQAGPPDPRDARFCLEPTPHTIPVSIGGNIVAIEKLEKRIDYIFVERPTPYHTFNLDVTRIRRRSFRRAASSEGMEYLSDHLGLDVTLIASPCS